MKKNNCSFTELILIYTALMLLVPLFLQDTAQLFAQEISNHLLNQETIEDAKNTRPFSIRAYFAPQLHYRTLVAADVLEEALLRERNAREQASVGFSTGLAAGVRLSEQWSVVGGVALSMRGFQTQSEQLSQQQSLWANRFTAIDFPLGLRYHFLEIASKQGIWQFSTTLEAVPSIVLNKTETQWTSTGEGFRQAHIYTRTRGHDRMALLLQGSFEAQYLFSRHVSGFINLHGVYSLFAVNSNLALREYLYGGGLQIGIVWTP